MDKKVRKIAITGPESTGKSALTVALAKYYSGCFVPEFARDYIANLGREYNYDDILTIASGQINNENEILTHCRNDFLFCDTELIVTRIWCLHKFGKCHKWIDETISQKRYDLYLLCDIDLPWEFDVLREHPHLRDYFFQWYRKELETLGISYRVVSGTGETRLKNAIAHIDEFFNQ